MNGEMNSRDRKVALVIVVLLAVAFFAVICSLSITGASLEHQIRGRWGLTEGQMREIKQLVERYRRGEISLAKLESDMLANFRNWGIVPPPGIFIPDMELFYTVKAVISTVNVALVLMLLFIYVDVYRKTKAQFSIGLTIFSLVLLFYTLSSNPFMQMLFGFRAFGLGPFAMLPDIFAFAALTVLLYLSLK
ncbi:MAG: hypothetical protein QXK89_08945 [Candidatus Bathyarchaeia archaeon]